MIGRIAGGITGLSTPPDDTVSVGDSEGEGKEEVVVVAGGAGEE